MLVGHTLDGVARSAGNRLSRSPARPEGEPDREGYAPFLISGTSRSLSVICMTHLLLRLLAEAEPIHA